MKSKVIFSFVLACIFTLFTLSCNTTANTGSGQMVKVANFSFTPENSAPPKSQNVSFVLINPHYAPTFEFRNYLPFSEFAKAMAKDAEQVVISRGFSIFGPYQTPDVMVYSDKKNSDLILEISIEPEVNYQNVLAHSHLHPHYPAAYYDYTFDGTIVLSGKINMTLKAVWNQEKLWVKSIPLEQKTFTIASTKRYVDKIIERPFAANDPGVINPFVDAFEDYYKVCMQTVYAHLDPEEMKSVKAQADEIKEQYQK